ncbi:MAG: UDP-3-O-(3-hydroxymyristoyl)glucosamine N-acyltransferase [Gammaproteobacteria bacterium]|nr:MAG: UDP-3-O-(3-hydroxymyristoyl)glucosamine N-acyltransferase [Gammaproteobacteria bacterium]
MSALIFTLSELAQHIGAELVGDSEHKISALASLQAATPTDLTFIANPVYKKYLAASKAGAIICSPDLADQIVGNKLVVVNPYLCYAQLTALFDKSVKHETGVHPSAVIGRDCILGKNICVGANAVVGDRVNLGDEVNIGPGVVIGNDAIIGNRTRLYANVTIYHGINIGSDCIFHGGCVIGADGFGFAHSKDGWVKIHQLGGVSIGNKVEIGANTTIDRGALDDTIIEDGVIIDNLVQIGHNVRLGRNTAIAGHTAIGGSTTIGSNCTIAGAVGVVGHLTLVDKVHITAMSLVSSSINEAGSYSSGVPLGPTKEWRKNAVRFRQLDSLATRFIKFERNGVQDQDE